MRHHQTLAMGLMAALSVSAVQAQDLARTLIEQGKYWQSRSDAQRAAEVWLKLLKLNPTQPEALAGMAVAEAEQQRYEQANGYLAKLRTSNPNHPALASAEESINLIRNSGQLKNARDLARSGKADEAVAKYQSSIGTSAPKGALALEYYQTLGGSSQGWDKARAGLEQLAREQPNDAAVQLALGQHLTYREATRREGINILAKIAGNPSVGTAATESWKKALIWTSGRSAYQSLYKDYLRLYPNDAEVRERLNELEQQIRNSRGDVAANDPIRKRSQAALELLEAGQTDKAQAELLAVLQERPEDSDALGGMGIVRMREENFVAARDFLKRATKNSNSNRWKPALDSATYWALINEAASARTNGNMEMALQKLQQAVKLNPQDVTAENDLASTLADMSQLDAAEAAYRRVLARQAENPDALRGLVNVLSQNNKPEEALKIVDGMSASQQERIGAMGALRATQALGKAKAAAARGDDAAARGALDQALVNDPTSPWVRLEMARQYLKMGARNEARGIMDGLLDANPYESEALYAHALLASEMQDWSGALATLDKIAVARRTSDVAKLYKRVWVHVQADAASALAMEGRSKEAMTKLQSAEPFVSDDPELQGKVALTYADLGENTRALAAMRQLLAKSPKPDVNLRLQYAAVLFKTRHNAELAGVLRQVVAMPMNAQQRQGYEDLRVGYTLRQIEALREAGELSTAYETLAPILAERPNDPTAVGALARLYAANNNPGQGLALYNQLLERDPNNLALLLQSATLATSAKEYSYAESALQVALAREPQNPEVLTAIGRLYRAQGKNTKATEFFTAAVTYEKQMRDAQLAAAGVQAQAKALNPFTNRSEQLPRLPTGIALDKNLPGPLPANSILGQLNGLFTNASRAEPSALTALPPLPAAGEGAVSMGNPNSSTSAPRGKPTPANYLPATYQPAPLALDRSNNSEEAAPRAKRGKKTPAADITKASSTVDKDKLNPVKPIQRATNPPDLATPLVTQPISSLSSPSQSRAIAAPAQALPVSQVGDEPGLPSTALALDRPGSSGLVQFAPIDNPPVYGDARTAPRFDVPVRNLVMAQRDAPAPRMESQPAPNRPRTAMDDLNELQQNRIPTLSMGAVVRSREGESGLGQLTDVQTPVVLRFDTGESKVSVNVTPTSLFSGTPDNTTATRFGAGPEQSVNNPNLSPGSQSASGVGVGVVYENDKLKADIGTTPVGFLKTDYMGGLKYRFGVSENTNLTVDVSRRPVTDSLLSFAGVKDARTGDIWGAVASTGGRFDLSWDNGNFGLYTYGSAHSLTGSNVANNTRLEGGGGLYWKMDTGPNASFRTGLNITGLGFDKNLRYFTYGQGGYFSPQRFFSVSVPVEWSQRSNKFSYQLRGSLGLQTFTEDASPYFPTDATRQANGAAAVAANAGIVPGITANGAYYAGQSVSGLGYAFGGAMEYQIHPQLYVGGALSLDNAKDYKQLVGSMYLRYFLDPYSGLPNLPPLSVKSPYAP